ncbi:cobyrinate a,c-diamide synthase [Undibacterium seohonense]|uniref:Cobyrinate a,c-diamide synthase n=2 Tax=Undibacterium seohonense TaxID=1344950 RepID=A0ABR6X7R6_9BURK|nr:cobyrinate a,c-diamide synthase [Undibacterium seohonense]
MISAIASGQGKTTVTAAIARHFTQQGKRVRVFKTGADFIDPMMLQQACGGPVLSLDLWLVGLPACRALLMEAAQQADLVLIEGVMGLYDGTPSSADLANAFGVPVLAVIDASAMAQTVGAVALGLRDFGPVQLAGVVANRIASDGHLSMIQSALRDIPVLASLRRQDQALPERHLGLVLPDEVGGIDEILNRMAADVSLDINAWNAIPRMHFTDDEVTFVEVPQLLAGKCIAIARDASFAFLYPANLLALEQMGAELRYFSPLANQAIPVQADALYLPGGYPELHAETLSQAQDWLQSLAAFQQARKPIYAECGGMISLVDCLIDQAGKVWNMAGLLSGTITMQKRLAALGMQSWMTSSGELRGHTFHYSTFDSPLAASAHTVKQKTQEKGEVIYQVGSLQATYFHAYFPSNYAAAARLFLTENRS